MLNDVLAVCVAGAVVVVIATILGAVDLLRKPVAAIAADGVGCRLGCHRRRGLPRQRSENSRHENDPLVSLATRDELRGDRPAARRVDTQAMRRSQNLRARVLVFWPR